MRLASAFCFLLLSLLPSVYSRPVPGALKIMSKYDRMKHASVPRNQERVAALHKANKEANSQYKHMERVLANPKKPEHAAVIQKAFGNNPDLTAIAKNVKELKKKTLLVKTVEDTKHGVYAFSRKRRIDNKKHLHFTDQFFNRKTALGKAGTLIHEASHQLFDTKDNFEKNAHGTFRPVSKTEADRSQHSVKSGYLHKDYEELKQNASPIMHHNADSYKVFGHHAKYGANTPMVHEVGHH